jgi:tetratricopeptide (TPR) repeat protein
MARLGRGFWAVPLVLVWLGLAGQIRPLCSAANAQQMTTSTEHSWSESITSPIKKGLDKLGRALNPKPAGTVAAIPTAEDDAVSLKNDAKPGPDLFVALARLYQQAGKMPEAELQYQMALKEKPNHLPAMLGYAQLKEVVGKPGDAIQLYQRAVKAYPRQASIYNNLGMCLARQSRLDEAAAAMNRAVELEPKNPLYRNNIATVLVDQGKPRAALDHLLAVHSAGVANYNMGYLLNKKGQSQAAVQYFAAALKADPSLVAARQWLTHLQQSEAQPRSVQSREPRAGVSPQAPMPREQTPTQSDGLTRRLPPTTWQDSSSGVGSASGIAWGRTASPAVPLPSASTNTALRSLPRVN